MHQFAPPSNRRPPDAGPAPRPALFGSSRNGDGGGQAQAGRGRRCLHARQGVAGSHHPYGRRVRRHPTPRRTWRVPWIRATFEGTREAGRPQARRCTGTASAWTLHGAPVPVAVGEETFEKAGVRYKGNGTIGDVDPQLHQEVDQDRPRPCGRCRAVRRLADDQPALRGDRPDRSAARSSGTRPTGRPVCPCAANGLGRGAPDRARQARQGTARPLHGGGGGGQAVPGATASAPDKELLHQTQRACASFEDRGEDWDKYKKQCNLEARRRRWTRPSV